MKNYIHTVEVNICGGLFQASLNFQPGLNIISGENGTFKTKLLQAIGKSAPKNVTPMPHNPSFQQVAEAKLIPDIVYKAFAVSPKRNSERRSVAQILSAIRNAMPGMELNTSGVIVDQGFQVYPSAGELFLRRYDDVRKDGGSQKDCMKSVTDEFNAVLTQVFSDYKIVTEWDSTSGSPDVKILKKESQTIGLEALSVGEQEILSLILNLYVQLGNYDIFLIDEPEIHLNWHLEERLFKFFLSFSEKYKKQLFVVTHSRAIFNSEFLPATQFLFWNAAGKIAVSQSLSDELKGKLTGEAMEVIKLGDFKIKTLFVEDASHSNIVAKLGLKIGKRIAVSECGNSSNVKSLFKHAKNEGWEKSFFMIDGDNQGNPFPSDPKFIHLDKYCIENYLLDIDVIGLATERTTEEVREKIFEIIKSNRSKILDKNKYLDFLFDRLKVEDITDQLLTKLDGSLIVPPLLGELGINRDDFLTRYIEMAYETGKLKAIFPPALIELIESE